MAFLAAAAPLLTAVSAGVGAIGAISSATAASNNANFQAQVASNNAIAARNNATYALKAGEAKTQAVGLRAAQQGGAIKAAQAANGVDVNSGSAVDVQTSAREQGDLDEATTEHNAALQAYGYRTQATNFDAQAQLDKSAASSDLTGGFLNAGAGLLSSASSISTKWPGYFGGSDSSGDSAFSGYNQTGLPGNVVGG